MAKMFEFDKKDLKFMGSCPICKSEFIPQNIKALKNKGAAFLFHVDCRECKSSLLVTLIKSNTGVVTNVGVLTDLSKNDFMRFKNLPAITVDEVLYFDNNNDKNDTVGTKK